MKLLFDENVSHKLVKIVEHLFPDSKHIKEIQLIRNEDHFIFDYAVRVISAL